MTDKHSKSYFSAPLPSGEIVGALGMSEPSGGSDVQAMRTQAIGDGDEYVINGQKVFIANGHTADMLLLACKTDPTARAKGISLILVETDRPGFNRGRKLDKLGCRCLQLFGGWGSMWEFPIARAYADARMSRIGGGAVEVMKQIIANSLLPPQAKMARQNA